MLHVESGDGSNTRTGIGSTHQEFRLQRVFRPELEVNEALYCYDAGKPKGMLG